MWSRILYNGYEPDNKIFFTVLTEDDGTIIETREVTFSGMFNDGEMQLQIYKCNDGRYAHILDGKVTICETYDDAWNITPTFITTPDDFQDNTPIDVTDLDTEYEAENGLPNPPNV